MPGRTRGFSLPPLFRYATVLPTTPPLWPHATGKRILQVIHALAVVSNERPNQASTSALAARLQMTGRIRYR